MRIHEIEDENHIKISKFKFNCDEIDPSVPGVKVRSLKLAGNSPPFPLDRHCHLRQGPSQPRW